MAGEIRLAALRVFRRISHKATGGVPLLRVAELRRLNDGGMRGIRFTQFDPRTAVTTIDMIEPLAKRVTPLGWHVQIHLRADQIVGAADMLRRLPGTGSQSRYDAVRRLQHEFDYVRR